MKVNEEKDIDITFPKDYASEELKGAKVVFKVKVNEIKEKVERKFDKELFDDLAIDGVDSKESLEDYIKKDIVAQKEVDVENKYVEELLDAVSKNVEVDIPEQMVEEEVNRLVQRFEDQLKMQGASLELYYELTKTKEEDLKAQMEKEAYSHVLYRLVLEELQTIEKIEVTDKEVEKEVEDLSKKYNVKKDELINGFGGLDLIKYDLEVRKVIEKLKEYNK